MFTCQRKIQPTGAADLEGLNEEGGGEEEGLGAASRDSEAPVVNSIETVEISASGVDSDAGAAGAEEIPPSAVAPGAWSNVWSSIVSTAQTATVALASRAKSAAEGTFIEVKSGRKLRA